MKVVHEVVFGIVVIKQQTLHDCNEKNYIVAIIGNQIPFFASSVFVFDVNALN